MDATDIRPDEPPLAFPPAPQPAAPAAFPLVASVAPLMASGVIWAITQSPFALVFAGLSPIIALAGVADGRRHSRRARRRARVDRVTAIERLTAQVHERHDRERLERWESTPSATVVMGREGRIGRWAAHADRFGTISLGSGSVRSALQVGGEAVGDDERALRHRFAELSNAPIEADATRGIGVIGAPALTRSVARGLLIQLVHAHPPGSLTVAAVPDDDWEWVSALPHGNADAETGSLVRILSTPVSSAPLSLSAHAARAARDAREPRTALIVLAPSLDELALPCRVIMRVDGPASARVLTAPNRDAIGALVPESVTAAQAARYAAHLAQHASAFGYAGTGAVLPDTVALAELEQARALDSSTSLSAAVGSTSNGDLTIDLVSDGPHVVVAGTTGSGKSELLTTWVAALASAYSPAAVGFLLVDFKGGSAFTPLTRLPHCLGLITDLGQGEAERALRSMKAELRRRERALAAWGVRSVAEAAGRLGRLVIVVDEFATMLDSFPELHALFVDIAARGRSLGVHTILCTQRPAGVVRDALLANCALRISLRVNDALDSIAVVGTDAASRLSAAQPGRCVIARDGTLTTAQIATTAVTDIETIVRAIGTGPETARQRRPWLDPLPGAISLESLPRAVDRGIVIGVDDVPDEQRQSVVTIRPDDGHLLVVGIHGSGKSTTLQTIAVQCAGRVRVVRGEERLWDLLESVVTGPAANDAEDEPREILVIDDLDALIARMPDDYQDAAVERLARVLRDGPGRGICVVAAVQRMTPQLRACASLFTSTLLLEQKDKQEHVLAGGDPELFDACHRPGAGIWRGHRIQIAGTTRPPVVDEPTGIAPIDLATGRTILVSRTPAVRARDLRRSMVPSSVVEIGSGIGSAAGPELGSETGPGTGSGTGTDVFGAGTSLDVSTGKAEAVPAVLIADPDTWQSAWPLFSSLKRGSRIVFDGCGVGDVRALLHSRVLPPLNSGADRVWVLHQNGRWDRARIASAADAVTADGSS